MRTLTILVRRKLSAYISSVKMTLVENRQTRKPLHSRFPLEHCPHHHHLAPRDNALVNLPKICPPPFCRFGGRKKLEFEREYVIQNKGEKWTTIHKGNWIRYESEVTLFDPSLSRVIPFQFRLKEFSTLEWMTLRFPLLFFAVLQAVLHP